MFNLAAALLAGLLFLCGPALADDPALRNNPALNNGRSLTYDQTLSLYSASGGDSPEINGFTVEPQIGTLGVGLNIGYQTNDVFRARINLNHLPLTTSRTIKDIDFKAKYDSTTIGLLADVHPFSGNFRLTGGLYHVNMSADLTAEFKGDRKYKIGDTEYSSDELDSGEGTVEWKRIAPYLGLGFSTGDGLKSSGFFFSGDFGALFFGDPKVSLKFADSAYQDHPELANNVRDYETKAEKDIHRYLPVWPVLSLGFGYRHLF
jgi:hypothetical protein